MSITPVINEGIGPGSAIKHVIRMGLQATAFSSSGNHLVSEGLGGGIANVIRMGLSGTPGSQSATVCTSTSWSGYSLQEDQSPAVAVGDTFLADLVTTPGGYAITVNGDGTVTIDAHGDTTRQYFYADIYDVSLAALYGRFLVYVNNHAPQINVQPANIRILTNNPMTALNFTPTDPAAVAYIIDQDADPITSAQISGALPTGVSLASNVLSGTPTSVVSNDVVFRFTDIAGDYVDCTLSYVSDVGAVVPNCVGLTSAEASTALAAVGLSIDPISDTAYSPTVPVGNIISQGTVAGSRVFSGSSVILLTSLGVIPVGATVPDLTGLTIAAATAVLAGNTLTLTDQPVASNAPAGTVIGQTPAAGTGVDAFTGVTVYSSIGPAVAGDTTHIQIKPRRRHTSIRR